MELTAPSSESSLSAFFLAAGLALGFFAFGIWLVGLAPIPKRAAIPPCVFLAGSS